MKMNYEKPALQAFNGWNSMFAAGASFEPPDPGCFVPGMESSDCSETGIISS